MPDNAPNAASVHYGGHRIRDVMPAGSGSFADSDLRDATLYLNPSVAGLASWKVDLPEGVKMWHWWPTGSRWRPNGECEGDITY